MKGIIFVVWEKYLQDRFGTKFIDAYRDAIGEEKTALPMTSRIYPDELLIKGVDAAHHLSFMSADRLLFEYGRYFILNGLVEYLCGHLLAQAWSGYDLLLLMRDAHAQMRRTPDGVMPPLFEYEVLSGDHQHMTLTYDSKRQLCSLLDGAVHGSAERFGERVETRELSCLKRGDAVCRFDVTFAGESWAKRASPEVIAREKQRLSKQGVTNLILQTLPADAHASMSLSDIKLAVDQNQGAYFPDIYQKQAQPTSSVHISQLYTGLAKLQQVGLVSSTINQDGDTFANRRFWRSPTTG